ncbi:MAG: response regulator [Pseudomonadota bacterium]
MSFDENQYLTPTEVATLLKVSPVTVRQWAQKGMLPAQTTAGGHRRFDKDEVERFARERNMGYAITPSVLVVDDDAQLKNYLVAFLQTSVDGLEVHSAADGFEAGRLVQQYKPSIVILDIMMPGVDGVQVCRSIKQESTTAHAHVVAMTGHFTDILEQRVIAAGAAVLLKKPFDSQELLVHCGLQEAATLGKH